MDGPLKHVDLDDTWCLSADCGLNAANIHLILPIVASRSASRGFDRHLLRCAL
jgi:hypothetical protein